MNEQEIKNLIQQMIDNDNTSNQFAVSQTPFHTHNGIDSALLQFTNLKDVPLSYNGYATGLVIVNTDAKGLTFLPSAGTSGQFLISNGASTLPTFQTKTIPVLYGGYVSSGGSAGTPFPSGWTTQNTGAGNYLITHSLGTANYAVTVTGESARECNVTSIATNDFVVLTRISNGTLTNGSFNFILLVTP